jgi:hypothetical protein
MLSGQRFRLIKLAAWFFLKSSDQNCIWNRAISWMRSLEGRRFANVGDILLWRV